MGELPVAITRREFLKVAGTALEGLAIPKKLY